MKTKTQFDISNVFQKHSENENQNSEKRVIQVEVAFQGYVTVEVPAFLEDDVADLLANKLALAKILATVENPDSGHCEEEASEDFMEETKFAEQTVDELWDASTATGVSGTWILHCGCCD